MGHKEVILQVLPAGNDRRMPWKSLSSSRIYHLKNKDISNRFGAVCFYNQAYPNHLEAFSLFRWQNVCHYKITSASIFYFVSFSFTLFLAHYIT